MSETYRICTLPGDGIGPEIIAEGKRVLAAVGERHGVAFSLVSSVPEGLRLDEIKKNTGNDIRAVRFNEKGDLVAKVEHT